MAAFLPPFANTMGSGGSMPIGSSMLLPDAGAFITLPDKTEWIRQSNAIKYSSKYSKAASLNYLQIQGEPSNLVQVISSGNHTSFGYANLSACNNTGTIIIITNISLSGVNGRISTNGGSTWADIAVATNAGYYIKHIIWAGDRFVLVASTAANDSYAFYYSAAGSTWTAGNTVSVGGAAAPNAPMLAYEPTSGSILCYGRTLGVSNVYRCTSGATFAAVGSVNSGASTGSPAIAATNNKVLVLSMALSTNCSVSTDGGASFTNNITVPGVIAGAAYVYTVGNTFILNDNYYTNTPETPSSWLPSGIPISGATTEVVGTLLSGDRKTVYISGTTNGYLKSTDGLNWIFTGITPPNTIGYGSIPTWAAVYDCGTNLFILKAADIYVTGLYGYVVPKNSAQYIGSFANRDSAIETMYIRIY